MNGIIAAVLLLRSCKPQVAYSARVGEWGGQSVVQAGAFEAVDYVSSGAI